MCFIRSEIYNSKNKTKLRTGHLALFFSSKVTGLIKLRKVKTLEDLRKVLTGTVIDTIRSTVFLGVHGTLFMPPLCAGRWASIINQLFYRFVPIRRQIFGHISYYKLYFQILCCTLPSIFIERKNRRGALALYMANLVSFDFARQFQTNFVTK